jgi:CelD/BcsL family acetyltransferase involved in cellulose biosynthesis
MLPLPGPDDACWDRLALASDNVFATRAWAECWWEVHGGASTPLVLTDGPEPTVVVPLHVTGRPVRQVRLLGAGPADQLGPACAPEDLDTAGALLRSALGLDTGRAVAEWDVLLLQDVSVGAGWERRLGGREIRRVASPVLRLGGGGDWDAFLATRSKNFREQVRRRERRLERSFDVVLRHSTAQTLAADLDLLFELHRLRWGDGAPFASPRQQRFHRLFAAEALARGWLRLRVLELDGRPVAAVLGYRFGTAESFYQSGRDPALEEHSVGSVLLARAVRDAVQDGAQEYRLLRGAEPYKQRWADGDAPVHTLATPRGVVGHLALALSGRRRQEESSSP